MDWKAWIVHQKGEFLLGVGHPSEGSQLLGANDICVALLFFLLEYAPMGRCAVLPVR